MADSQAVQTPPSPSSHCGPSRLVVARPVRSKNGRVPVRELRVEDAGGCDDIVRGLPHFFGSEAGNVECARARTSAG